MLYIDNQIYEILFDFTCSNVIAVTFLQLPLELDSRHHQAEQVESVARTFHGFQRTME